MVAAAVLVGGCSDGEGDRASAPTTTAEAPTTSTSSTSSSTTVAPTTTAAARPSTTSAAPSPESRARTLFDAWAAGDQAAAGRVAEPEAVAALFARQWQAADGWNFAGCSGAAGTVICTWQRPAGQQLLFRIQNVTGGTVAEVRFQP